MHFDMDMFFAAIEIRDDPSLEDKPVGVGDYLMLTTTNYIARKAGVKSGMPGFIGRKLCPNLVFIKPNYPKYRVMANKLRKIAESYDECYESLGLDEVYLDVTQYLKDNGLNSEEGAIFLGQKIRREIKEVTGLTATGGIGCNKLLAKICGDLNKPDGLTFLPPLIPDILSFMKT